MAKLQRVITKRGVTLIEFVITILILSIISAIMFYAWPGRTITLNVQAKDLISNIRYTQNLAITRGNTYYLSKVTNTSYKISNISGTVVTHFNLGDGLSFGTFSNLPNTLIAFNAKGVPLINLTAPGTPLSATATIRLTTTEGNSKTVSITPQTGRVF